MNFLFGGFFWGGLLVLIGLSMILKTVFKIDIPVFRLVFAVIIIYWGIKLLFGTSFTRKSETNVIFNDTKIEQVVSGKEYNVIFGRSSIDLRDIEMIEGKSKVKINVVFGHSEIYINPDMPMKIIISTVFAESKLPRGHVSFFGDHVYKSPAFVEGEDYLKVELDVVFGNAIIRD
jgi:predicted membrane protein